MITVPAEKHELHASGVSIL